MESYKTDSFASGLCHAKFCLQDLSVFLLIDVYSHYCIMLHPMTVPQIIYFCTCACHLYCSKLGVNMNSAAVSILVVVFT